MAHTIIIPMITPHRNGKLDTDALEALLEYARLNRFDGVFAASSTGGCASLSYKRHLEVIGEVMKRASGLKLFANISRNDLEETLDMMKDAVDIGYENLVAINPYYHRYSQESMGNFFSEIAGRTSNNLYLYNNPSLTGLTVSPELVSSVSSQHSSIRGIKDSGGDLEKFREFLKIPGIEVFQGKDHLLEESIKLGAFGGVCSTSNFSLNTLHIAHDEGDVSDYTRRIVNVSEVMKKNEVPAFHNYMFRKFVLGEENPSNYMNWPFTDLSNLPDDPELAANV